VKVVLFVESFIQLRDSLVVQPAQRVDFYAQRAWLVYYLLMMDTLDSKQLSLESLIYDNLIAFAKTKNLN